MKIGFFIQNDKRGGLDTFVINLINFWPRKKDKLFIIYNKDHKGIIDYKKKIKRNIKYIKYDYFLNQNFKFTSNFILKFLIKITKYILLFNSIYIKPSYFEKIYRTNKIDKILIINGGYYGGEACNSALFGWKRYKPNDLPWYNFHSHCKYKKSKIHFIENYLRNIIDKKVLLSSKGFISVSKACINSLKLRPILKNTKKKFIFNGCNLVKKSKFLYKKNKFKKISMLAVYEPNKGFQNIIKTMFHIQKFNKNFKLFIYGDGNKLEKKIIKSNINKYGLNDIIILKKFTPNIEKIYSTSDLIVIPSFKEAFGYVVIESFFYKVPVLAYRIKSLNEIIKNNYNGYLVKKFNTKLFAKKIIHLLENSNLRNKFIKNGYEDYKKKYTAELMTKKYYNLIINE